MNIELTEKLVSKYPSIFAQYGGDPKDTSMAYGIECGNGWFDIIDTLCNTIQSEVDHINFNYEVSLRCEAVQVKEKYGSLRFYIHFFFDENLDELNMKRVEMSMNIIHGAITMAERMTAKICETCGDKSSLSNDIFPKSECEACATLRYDALSNRDLS